MHKRTRTYVAFDGCDTTNPQRSDIKFYNLLKAWHKNNNKDFSYLDAHETTYQVKDSSEEETLKKRLVERLKNSRNMLLILSENTRRYRKMLNFEIQKAIEYKIPIIVAYTELESIYNNLNKIENYFPEELRKASDNTPCLHIPFKESLIHYALEHFGVTDGETKNLCKLCYFKGR